MTFREIEAKRLRAGLTISELCRRAGLWPSTYRRLARQTRNPMRGTLAKLDAGFERAPRAVAAPKPEPGASRLALIAGNYGGYLAFIAPKLGFDAEDVSRGRKARGFWKVRALAIYCTAIEFDIRGAELGRAIGVSKQLVSWNLRQAEDMRDDKTIDELVERAGALIAGRAAAA